MKKEKIGNVIGNISGKYVEEAGLFEGKKRKFFANNKVKWVAVAAGVVLVAVAGIGLFQSGLIVGNSHKAKLENGNVISFAKSKEMGKRDIAVWDYYNLSDKELSVLFSDLNVEAVGLLDKNAELMGISGKVDDMKLIVSANGKDLNDTILVGKEEVSYVNGVPVVAGYFVTDKNNEGERTIIYYATIKLGEHKVYLEHAGDYSDSKKLRKEIADKIEYFAELGEINLDVINK
ncbi:MAG: hypothetical protein E7266_02185 [Lachnospiraceae bacterium]|nr:hypothetical protein [Lachnospiraceae bacterium]